VALAAVMACEVAVRHAAPSLSKDMQHIREFPEIARELHSSQRLEILFLGNSLTGAGTDLDAFQSELEQSALHPAYGIVCPDNTTLSEWYYIFKNVFAVRQQAPDVAIIGFHNRQMCDSETIRTRKLGHDFCEFGDTAEVFEHDLTGFDERATYLLSSFSAAYAYQDRIKHRTLDRIIPDFRFGMGRINEIIRARRKIRETQASRIPRPTYRRLKRFMAMLRRSGTHGVFVAMPSGDWALDPAIAEIVRQAGMTFVDGRTTVLPVLTRDYFRDGYHLDKAGAGIYSRFLAKKLVGELKKLSERRNRTLDD